MAGRLTEDILTNVATCPVCRVLYVCYCETGLIRADEKPPK